VRITGGKDFLSRPTINVYARVILLAHYKRSYTAPASIAHESVEDAQVIIS